MDPSRTSVTAEAYGVRVVVRPSAWDGSPGYLPAYVTPFHVALDNQSGQPLRYEYADFQLFDEGRFQYTALPPSDVVWILRWGRLDDAAPVMTVWGGRGLYGGRWWLFWDPWWWGPPYYYARPPAPPRLDSVLTRALAVGTLQTGARSDGYVFFPRLRPEASRLSLEFGFRLGDETRRIVLPFLVERTSQGRPERLVAAR
jgi:hypothetical protein